MPDPLDDAFDEPLGSGAATLAFMREEVAGFHAKMLAVPGTPQAPLAQMLDSFLWHEDNPHALNHMAYIAGLAYLVARVDAGDHEAAGKGIELAARARIMWGEFPPEPHVEHLQKPNVSKTEAEKLAKDDPAVLQHERVGRRLAAERDLYELLRKRLGWRCALLGAGHSDATLDDDPGADEGGIKPPMIVGTKTAEA
jgi:hypothetical protein